MHTRPVWAEISRSRLIGNYERLRALAGGAADVLAVVKGDAYGHSATICAPWLAAAGAEWLGVTNADEGVAVRELCPDSQILVMAVMYPAEADAVLDARLVPTVWDSLHLDVLGAAAGRRHLPDGGVRVHLEIDTGMSRQGVAYAPDQLKPLLDHLRGVPALRLDGVFTHFASPEVAEAAENHLQLERFRGAVELVAREGFRPRWIHGGNSTTLLRRAAFEPVFAALAEKHGARLLWRPGLALYGYSMIPGDDAGLAPVLAWKTRIASLRNISAGAAVGYNGIFVARRAMRLALLPVGYADGLKRKLSNSTTSNSSDPFSCSHVLVGGAATQIVGRVSMDLTTIDVSHMPKVAVGDEVVILGEQNGRRITATDHAAWAETIPYEILCGIAARVPRMRVD